MYINKRSGLPGAVIALLLFIVMPVIAVAADGIVRFVQISDVHFNPERNNVRNRMLHDSDELLDDAISQVNDMQGIDFVVFTGDIIDGPSEKLLTGFAQKANRLKVPWMWTIGNHDVGPGGLSSDAFRKAINKYNKTLKPASANYAFTIDSFIFVMLNGASDTRVTSNGFFDDKTLAYLSDIARDNPDKSIFVFQHFPLVEPFRSVSHEVLNAGRCLQLINRNKNIKAVFSGHYHSPKMKVADGVVHISAPALVQYPNAFRIITIREHDGKTEMTVEMKETRLKDVQAKSLAATAGRSKITESPKTFTLR